MKTRFSFRPKLLECLKGYGREDFRSDVVAGLTVGVIALPLAMAFAMASGVPPQAGIITAVIAGFLISALGGTRVCIGGPTGAFIAILYGIHLEYGMENLALCTIMAGLLLLVMGITRMGSAIKFIPHPVIMGFTSGIAVLIFSTQIKDFLGLQTDEVPSEFFDKLRMLAGQFHTLHWPTVVLGVLSFLCLRLWPARWRRALPGTVVALLAATVVVAAFHIPVETIGTRFGGISQALPAVHFPVFEWGKVRHLFQPALTIALLAAIESLLCAVVADGMMESRHDSNQELIAQGLANVLSPLFGGIAATSAIARTATNINSGARTPVAGVVHAVTLAGFLLVAAPLARFIPLATLSAVLINVALHMGEWHNFRRLPRWPRSDAAVFLSTFVLTVAVDLTVAVEVGMVLAAVLFIKRVAETTEITAVDGTSETEGAEHSLEGKEIPSGVMIYEVFGAFFFGAAEKLEAALYRLKQEPDILILRMRRVSSMDATGLNALEEVRHRLSKRNRQLILSGIRSQPRTVLENAGFLDTVGRDNVCPHIDAALDRARHLKAVRHDSS